MIEYLNYKTNSLFYYSESASIHNHENKALINPLFKLVNIEGDITQFDLFISHEAIKAAKNGKFEHWFYNEFMDAKA